ncbi:MAG: ATP-binding protein, partial [Candidatus Brocadiia bacterium]
LDGEQPEALQALLEQSGGPPAPSRLIVFSAGEEQADLLPSEFEQERLLWVSGEMDSPETVRRVREFLGADSHLWTKELGLDSGQGEFLLGSSVRGVEAGEGEAERVLRFAEELSGQTDLDGLLEQALGRYMEALSCQAGSLYLWDERSETLVLKAAEGPDQDVRLGLRQKLGEGLAGWVAEVGESILVRDTRKVQRLHRRDCHRYGDFSCLAAPIRHGEQLFGVVCLTMREGGPPLGEPDLRLAHRLSEKLASLILPLTLLSELRFFNDRLQSVFKSCSDMVVQKDSQMRQVRALSSDILDGLPLGVVAYDRHLQVRFANSAARELLDATEETSAEEMGAVLREGLDGQAEGWRDRLLSVLRDGEHFRIPRAAFQRPDGPRTLDIRAAPMHGARDELAGAVLTLQDVTDDVELERKLSSAERLALMGKIAAKVAHELNNPLDGMLRFLNLAERQMESRPDKARQYLEEARQGMLRLGNIVAELLAFSRSHRPGARAVSISRIIHQSLALYEERAQAAQTTFQVDVPAELPPCAHAELCEVFGNVIKNALDAMGTGGVLKVSAEAHNGEVKVIFADSGPGVPERVRDRIFDPFVTTKKDGNGTGLGLATCRDSLERMGGDIRLCPSEQGATFEITVPVEQPTA